MLEIGMMGRKKLITKIYEGARTGWGLCVYTGGIFHMYTSGVTFEPKAKFTKSVEVIFHIVHIGICIFAGVHRGEIPLFEWARGWHGMACKAPGSWSFNSTELYFWFLLLQGGADDVSNWSSFLSLKTTRRDTSLLTSFSVPAAKPSIWRDSKGVILTSIFWLVWI